MKFLNKSELTPTEVDDANLLWICLVFTCMLFVGAGALLKNRLVCYLNDLDGLKRTYRTYPEMKMLDWLKRMKLKTNIKKVN